MGKPQESGKYQGNTREIGQKNRPEKPAGKKPVARNDVKRLWV